MLNRAGESIFWASNNENFINYARCFSEGYFFQSFFAFILSNKSYNSFFFSFFRSIIQKKQRTNFIVRGELRFMVIIKILSKKHLKKTAKTLKKTFGFNDYFFSKVFFISFYKYLIITIKVFNRFYKFKKYKKKQFFAITTLFWKYYFLNFFKNKVQKNLMFFKKF